MILIRDLHGSGSGNDITSRPRSSLFTHKEPGSRPEEVHTHKHTHTHTHTYAHMCMDTHLTNDSARLMLSGQLTERERERERESVCVTTISSMYTLTHTHTHIHSHAHTLLLL